MPKELYKPEEVAAFLKVSKFTVYELIKRGELPASKVGRGLRITSADLRAYLQGSRSIHREPLKLNAPDSHRLRFVTYVGSHDLSIEILREHLEERNKVYLTPTFTGSLDALFALYKGQTEIAGCHLLDDETGEYNVPFVKKFLPSQEVTVIQFVHRWQGLMVAKGNPKQFRDWVDLANPDIRMVNRQKGSGTRILLDYHLKQLNVDPSTIDGYDRVELTHTAVAAQVAQGSADVGIGIESAAHLLDLEFIPLAKERYDFVIRTKDYEKFAPLWDVLSKPDFWRDIHKLKGYDTAHMGKIIAQL
ncbi:substrate-binding domain-containing protein [Ferviditalea candida]|uniref:Helix-turn-helix transcriptional regulator n=1 Tax=Ferviditalea candida TaxID=3108399 RepID=A0ABU5ZFU0_9BACL|nr:helix-turn-helix transcriptional regulator [Paenibacillaceae bacterium T2]